MIRAENDIEKKKKLIAKRDGIQRKATAIRNNRKISRETKRDIVAYSFIFWGWRFYLPAPSPVSCFNSSRTFMPFLLILEVPYAENVSEINDILDTYHKSIMNREMTIDEGIAAMNEEVGKVLGQ